MNSKNGYLNIIYDESTRPITGYPHQLANYIFERFLFERGNTVLDVGCGRGEFLRGFVELGALGFAVDQDPSAMASCPEAELRVSDIENDGIPYDEGLFDIVYSKSVIEHFHNPEKLVEEMYRVLKPGGTLITLCPAWEYNYKIYFEDFTHRTPFMFSSLRDIQLMHGFVDVNVEYFRQLPFLWQKRGRPFLILSEITRLICPPIFKKHSKWVRFSKEIMLLSSARKPL